MSVEMEKYIDVMRHMIELSHTCLEGVKYIQNHLSQGCLDCTVLLLEDFVHAFYSMDQSLNPMLTLFDSQHFEDMNLSVWDSIDSVVSAYEKDDESRALQLINAQLLPELIKWRSELEHTFYPYILS
jgi:hypothetical protein